MDPAGASTGQSRTPRGRIQASACRRPGSDAELAQQAETLRRLADQLEALAEERSSSEGGTHAGPALGPGPPPGTGARAPGREPLTEAEAEALLELPRRLEHAVRRVRLSAEILSYHLGSMTLLLHKAAGGRHPRRGNRATRKARAARPARPH